MEQTVQHAPAPAPVDSHPVGGASVVVRALRRVVMRVVMRAVGPPLFFLVVALCVMQPYHSPRMLESASGDLQAHVASIVEAAAALREGQFPIRVAPAASNGQRYPIFSFYGNLPYTAAAALHVVTGLDPYAAFKFVMTAALAVGGWYAYRCARWLTRRQHAALVAGAAFAMAPYVFTDVHARTAFPELVGFMLLPAILYYALRTFARGRPGDVIAGSVAWAAVALAHNIVYLFGSVSVCAFLLLLARARRRYAWRLARVGAGYAIGLGLVAWYVAPQVLTVDDLVIANLNAGKPVGARLLTSLDVLLWPTLMTPASSNTRDLGLQVGWPILAGVALAVTSLLLRRGRPARARVIVALLVMFGVSFVATWTPTALDFWGLVPRLFWNVQSTFRLLMFVTLWGSMLVGWAVATWAPGARSVTVAGLALLAVALAAQSYVRPRAELPGDPLAAIIAHPNLGGNGAEDNFLLRPGPAMRTTPLVTSFDYADDAFGILRNGWLVDEEQPFSVWPPPAGWLLEYEGEMPKEYFDQQNLIWAKLGTEQLTPTVANPGPFRVVWNVTAAPSDRPVGLTIQSNRTLSAQEMKGLAPPRSNVMQSRVRHLRFLPPGSERAATTAETTSTTAAATKAPMLATTPAGEVFTPASSVRDAVERGRTTRLSIDVARPTLLQLPVLYYPRLLRVWDNGSRIDYGNVGRLVALHLSPGRHELQVEHAGLAWANGCSAATWAGLGTVGVVAALRRRRHGRQPTPNPAGVGRPLKFLPAVGAVGVVVAGSLGPTLWAASGRAVDRMIHPAIECRYTASRAYSPEYAPDRAFDGNPETAWVVDGPASATLTIIPTTPAILQRIDLEPRRTVMIEGWNRARLDLFRNGKKVGTREVQFANAHTAETVSIDVPSTRTDRIDLTFSDPVIVRRDGVTPAGEVNPGYREIRLHWQGSIGGYVLP